MLISTRKERDLANQQNRNLILQFLLLHRYSTLKNIALELGHKSTASASRILKRLSYEKLVKKEVLKEEFIKVTLFGITQKGIDESGGFVDEHLPFYRSRVSFRNLKHTLTNQRVGTMIKRRLGCDITILNTEFGNLKKYEHFVNLKHRPDLLVVAKSRIVVAVETELSLKDTKRYRKIWLEYTSKIRVRDMNGVWYFVKNDAAAQRLMSLWKKEKSKFLRDGEADFMKIISMQDW